MSTFIIVWLWVVGLPPAYYVISKRGTTPLPTWLVMILAHAWPVSIPVLTVVGLAFK